jgi:lipopolysaccharide/colanic/teichoic acid biosynthesis glycosyltransferase
MTAIPITAIPITVGIPPGAARRALDILGALAGLVLLIPLLLLVYVLVRLGSPGRGIFRQVRVGQGGRPFTMLKFRTMRVNATGSSLTAGRDPRLTRLGALLRRTSTDELPQLWNVLRGDMTLIGPRPETPDLAARYRADCQWVFAHRPGLSGLAQLRLRDFDVLDAGEETDEQAYLDKVVPARLAIEARYLERPTLRATARAIAGTFLHIMRVALR